MTLLDLCQFDGIPAVEHASLHLVVERHCGDPADAQWLRENAWTVACRCDVSFSEHSRGMAEKMRHFARQVNIDATMTLLEISKKQTETRQRKPVFVFASSIAVFGIMPDFVTDDTPLKPQMSYGAHKVVGEVMLNEFSRRGWVDGRALRFSPGVASKHGHSWSTGQLSAFLSDIIREVSQGHAFVCPLSAQAKTWASSLPNIIENLVHGAALDEGQLKDRRTFTLPTLYFSMAELVDAIGVVYKQKTDELVRYQSNPVIEKLFGCFPPLETPAADGVGFKHDGDINHLVKRALLNVNRK
ncbi:NAD-dependent epimerase/dehydratase family protein [Vibrio sp. PP-XX7]